MVLPTGYIEKYLSVCYPLRYGLQEHLESIGIQKGDVDCYADPVLWIGDDSLVCPALVQTRNRGCLVIENISNDISGRCRVQWLYDHKADVSVLLILESVYDLQNITVKPDIQTYVLLYEDIWNRTYTIMSYQEA